MPPSFSFPAGTCRSLFAGFILSLACAGGNNRVAAASPEEVAAGLARNALTNTITLRTLSDLTTEVGQRLAGSEAEKRAALWAQKRLREFGFDRVEIESFPIAHGWARGAEEAEIVGTSPQKLAVTALGGSIATSGDGLEAEIAYFPTYEALLAAPTDSLAGKIAVVTEAMERTKTGSGYGRAGRIRHGGASQAARRGAIGFLMRSLGTEHHRTPHTGQMEYAPDAPKIPAAALSVPDAEQIDRLVALGKPIRIHMRLTPRELGPVTSQNVVADLLGSEQPGEMVILGAHLDSWDLATGALDDGAGVAVIMAAGKLIHDLPLRPKRTIRLVLYGSEEPGLLGGKAFAEKHKSEADHFVIAAEPDHGQGPVYKMVTGVGNTNEPSLKRIQSALAPLGVEVGGNSSRGSSDVEEIIAAGNVPAVTFEMDGLDYFDFHHTPDDTLDKVQPERINQTAAVYTIFAYLTAELDANYRVGP